MTLIVLAREISDHLRDYYLVQAGEVTVIEMEGAALGGWVVRKITHQGKRDWPDMSASEIRSYLTASKHGHKGAHELTGWRKDEVLEMVREVGVLV